MSKSENILAFEAALKESEELQEKLLAAQKRIVENKEASSESEVLVKAAAEVGYTLTIAEVERAIAQNQELSEEELENVSGGLFLLGDDWCWTDYRCIFLFKGNRFFDGIIDMNRDCTQNFKKTTTLL